MASAKSAAIDIGAVSVKYGDRTILRDITISVEAGSRVSIIGPSGCGKSTLLHLVAGILAPSSGQVAVGGETEERSRLGQCGLMPQRDLLLPWRTAIQNAAIALENRGLKKRAAVARAQPLFERFGLAEFEEAYPSQLSGGMRQRVSFLRTLLPDKPVLLLDEPFGALDAITRAQMQDWLTSALTDVPKTVLLVTHDVEEALLISDRVIVMAPRPSKVIADIVITLDRNLPRVDLVTSPHFVTLRHTALEALGW